MRQYLAVLAIWLVSTPAVDAVARGIGQEHPFAAEHIEGLPADVRRAVLTHERACGGKAASTHYFAVSIAIPGESFLSLHYEDFSCPNRGTLCTAAGCLHEVYAGKGAGYRRVFSVYAEDVRLTTAGGIAGLEVRQGGATQLYQWNGSAFAPARR